MNNEIYINSIKQISVQKPLSDEWFDHPIFYHEQYIRAIDADYKQCFTPNEARRLGKILKRALLVSREAMKVSDVTHPDAIITGTGLGCIENTEIFLDKLVREGEELLNPTHFMQSTHNTISSLVAIDAKCHGYNSTYAHKGMSFECALQDAFIQIKNNKIRSVLVGAHDEMTPAYFSLLKKAGYLGNENQVFAGETAVAMMLGTEKVEDAICKIETVEKFYGDLLGIQNLMLNAKPDFVMTGINGNEVTDQIYYENCEKLFPNIPLLQYKTIFGECYTAPALGMYAAAICLQKGKIPAHLIVRNRRSDIENPQKILCYNHFEGKNHSFILLSQ
jgi:hypothetical protein